MKYQLLKFIKEEKMRKIFKLLIILSILLIGCQQTPDDWNRCSSDKECKSRICFNGYCIDNSCINEDCGKGKCLPASMENIDKYEFREKETFHCECSENAVFVETYNKCIPTCDGYSEECANFGININECNIPVGHCSTICQGEGSCKEGYICQSGICWKKTD